MKAADGDISEIKTEFGLTAQKFKAKESDLKDFCEQTNLHRDRYREQVFAVDTKRKLPISAEARAARLFGLTERNTLSLQNLFR